MAKHYPQELEVSEPIGSLRLPQAMVLSQQTEGRGGGHFRNPLDGLVLLAIDLCKETQNRQKALRVRHREA